MSTRARALPWTALVEALGEQRLTEIRAALEADHVDGLDRDAFLLHRVPGSVFHDLVPEDGLPEAVNAYGTLLHMLYVMWANGWPVTVVDAGELRRRLSSTPTPDSRLPTPGYLQLPERNVWAQRGPGEPHEPLDGIFVFEHQGTLHAQAILGLHDLREGFTTMEVDAVLPLEPLAPRNDGSPAFAPVMPGGDRARLLSLVSPAELAWLAWLSASASQPLSV